MKEDYCVVLMKALEPPSKEHFCLLDVLISLIGDLFFISSSNMHALMHVLHQITGTVKGARPFIEQIPFVSGAIMFAHHIISLFGQFLCLYRGRYGTEMIATIFGTEITNPLLQLRW